MNNINETVYTFGFEEINSYSKEYLVNKVIEFRNEVNNRIGDLIARVKSQPQDPSIFDISSAEFSRVFEHEKTRFESMGVNKSTKEALQNSLNRSKTQVMVKQSVYESAMKNYNNECMSQYALSMVNDMFKQAYKRKVESLEQAHQLKIAEVTLKKKRQQNKIATASISLDEWQHRNVQPAVGNGEEVEVEYLCDLDGDGNPYNNAIDEFMNDDGM